MFKQFLKSFSPGQKVEPVPLKSEITFTVYRVRRPDGLDGFVDILALLPPEIFTKRGIGYDSIVGHWTEFVAEGDEMPAATFRPNKAFVALLHDVVAINAPLVPELQTAARKQHKGWLYILDARTPTPDGEVPLRDIIGAFEVREGAMVPDSYWANPEHLLFSSDGLFQLGSTSLQKALLERVMKASIPSAEAGSRSE